MTDPTAVVQRIGDFVWGPYLLIPLLLLTGLFLTLRLRGIQFRKLWHSLYVALIVRREKGAEGDISHFQALMTALAATVGTGNIVGVATAIATGGPGALFWMWMTGLVGMATKYSEALLSVKYRVTDERGEQCGGPMYYLANGIRWRGLGKTLGWLFALFAVCAAFGIGNMVQSNSVAHALQTSFRLPVWATGLMLAVAAGLVILGGIKSIGRFTGFFVPVMIVVYMLGSGLILVLFARTDPSGARPDLRRRLHRHRGDRRLRRRGRPTSDPFRRRARHLLQRVGARLGRHRRRRGADPGAGAPGPGLDDPDLHRHHRGLHLHRAGHPGDRRLGGRV